ncbi:MAG: T9SS type A sorting domain-containing protein [Bacteroidetes bacterium]|nr:T9SS type A sorting domain-containing protein [Bacteroidota bacterium]
MKKMTLLLALTVLSGLVLAGNPPKKMTAKLDKDEKSEMTTFRSPAKINESSVFVGNAANAYAWQAPGTNQIYYDVASSTLAIVKRRGSLDTQIPAGSGRIVVQKATDQGAGQSWSEGFEINGNLAPQVYGRHPNIAILTKGRLITQWAELYPMGADFQAIGLAVNKVSDGSVVTAANLHVELIAEIDDIAGNDTVGYGVPDEIFVDEKNGTFYFGGAADNATNTVYLWKSSENVASPKLVKLWKDSMFGGISAGVNNSHGDFCGDYGTYIISMMPDSATAAQNQMDQFKYSPYFVRFKYGFIVEEGFFDLSGLFSTLGIDTWTGEWDMVTDKKGNWHLFIQGYKDGEQISNIGIYEIYSRTPGLTYISAKKVADITLGNRVIDAANSLDGTAEIHAARDAEGKYVFVKYLDWDPTDAPETSTEMFVSGRAISSESFVSPIAVNNNDLAIQNFTQAAPRVSSLGIGDSPGTRKFQIHSSWVGFGGNPASGTSPANLYYVGPKLDLEEYINPGDSATLIFKVNTAFVQDTLSAASSVSIRGKAFGGDWSLEKGIELKNVGGDYWEAEKKVYIGSSGGMFKIFTVTASGTGRDRHSIGEFEITGDTTLIYFTTGLKEIYNDPITGAEITRGDNWNPLELAKNGDNDVYAVHFRVNMQDESSLDKFNSKSDVVTVRGSFNGWSASDTLKPEIRHDDMCCGLATYEAEHYYSKTVLIPKDFAGEIKYKFVYSNATETNWESSSDRVFMLSGDTTLYMKWFDGGWIVDPSIEGFPYKIKAEVYMEKAINTNGFNKSTDTLIARFGFLGSGSKTVDAKLKAPIFSTSFSGETGVDSLYAKPGSVVFYQYYKKNADGEFEEFYFDYYNTEPQSAAPKFRKLTIPEHGNTVYTQDFLEDEFSTHRQPFFKNMSKLGDSTLFTLNVDLRPALFYTESLGGTLSDIQGGPLVVDSENIRSLPVYINGPAVGGWKPWNADSLGESRKLKNNGKGQWTIDIQYTPDATVSQEFKLSIGGADNEAGLGKYHIANLFPSSTNSTSVQFGQIQPSRYWMDENNYWDFPNFWCFRNGYPCIVPHVESGQLPDKYSISAYPNPFNPATLISYSIPQAGKVSLKVFDLLGRQVAILTDEIKPAGMHQIPFRGDDLASGIYIVRMESGSKTESVKVILLK